MSKTFDRINKALRAGSADAQRKAIAAAGAGLASTTQGRARVFVDRKREQDRRACRGRVDCD